MAKIRLDLDALDVETFDTESVLAERGTVKGNACSDATCFQIVCDITWNGPGTCEATEVNCSGGTGTGTGTGPGTNDRTCCTGAQIECSCYN